MDKHKERIDETAYWKRRESIEKETFDYNASVRTKWRDNKERASGQRHTEKEKMSIQTREESTTIRDKDRRKKRAMTKDRWKVQMLETITERARMKMRIML